MTLATADISDQHPDKVQIAAPGFRDFGGIPAFAGLISTVSCQNDNSKVREALEEEGNGRVLVVDGSASMQCALLGDILAGMAREHGWAGVIVNGCIRDSAVIATLQIGVKALDANPLKSVKRGAGDRDVPVRFSGIDFTPSHWVCADPDGILVASRALA